MLAHLILFLATCLFIPLHAEFRGKVDLAPAYVHLDILESGRTIESKDMFAIRADGTVLFYEGWCIKPTFLITINHTDLVTGGIGIGHFTPLSETFSITPSIGCNWTYLRTTIDLEHPLLPVPVTFKERFQSTSPYLCLEACWTFYPAWRVSASYMYSWSKTKTTIKHLLTDKSHTQGPSYALLLEHDLSSCVSIQVGGAYNISLSKEKHGLRAAGAKVGLSYWF